MIAYPVPRWQNRDGKLCEGSGTFTKSIMALFTSVALSRRVPVVAHNGVQAENSYTFMSRNKLSRKCLIGRSDKNG